MPPRRLEVRCFTAEASGRTNTLVSDVFVAAAVDPGNPAATSMTGPFKGIWDTGATHSSISHDVVARCGLRPTGVATVSTAGGIRRVPSYWVNIGLPNQVQVTRVQVSENEIEGEASVLVGMDIIGLGDFAVTNKDGKTAFSFRIPSIERIDFVKSRPRNLQPVPGRNSPCPCGSGRKYKQCCGKV